MSSIGTAQKLSMNPYVGPRAFRKNELFFGREREASGLINTLIAGRIVLLHSPSGAGKTSLIQASVVPALEDRRFQVCARLKPSFSAIRVNAPIPEGLEVENRYIYSAVTGLTAHLILDPEEVRSWSIMQALDELARQDGAPQRQLLILDQFEEILTLDPTDQDGQRTFFKQVGEALENHNRWALFAMREDYMGGLDRYLKYLPGQLRSTFRLDLLDVKAALKAVQLPAKSRGITFEDEAALALVNDLRRVRVETPGVGVATPLGNYVEPVLLQVVCDSLWRNLSNQIADFSRISATNVVDYGPLDDALARYYRYAIKGAVKKNPDLEGAVRDWVQSKLLTEQLFRSQTREMPAVPNADEVVAYLQHRYLVRDDPRPNATWWELSHDRLIDPIVENNRIWREKHFAFWQLDAYKWDRSHRDSSYLLTGETYRAAQVMSRKLKLSEVERDFLRSSGDAVAHEGRLKRAQSRLGLVRVLLFWSLLCNLALAVYLLRP